MIPSFPDANFNFYECLGYRGIKENTMSSPHPGERRAFLSLPLKSKLPLPIWQLIQ